VGGLQVARSRLHALVVGASRQAVCAAAAVVLSGCADTGYDVTYRNATQETVVVSAANVRDPSLTPIPHRLAPTQTFGDFWPRPIASSESPAVVRAEDEAGTLIFCRQYTYADMKRLKFKIVITEGPLDCR